jgi:predicted regulator of Ras-like GTPase activity (Roadblock/LC7/MglB family)
MEAAEQALADLMEVSSQVEAAVLADRDGAVLASTLAPEAAQTLAEKATALVGAAPASSARSLTQLEAATHQGSLFVVRDGERTVAATTGAAPTVGLVFYDLKTCLRALAQPEEEKPRRSSRKKASDAAA